MGVIVDWTWARPPPCLVAVLDELAAAMLARFREPERQRCRVGYAAEDAKPGSSGESLVAVAPLFERCKQNQADPDGAGSPRVSIWKRAVWQSLLIRE